jgi:hypothetical protein
MVCDVSDLRLRGPQARHVKLNSDRKPTLTICGHCASRTSAASKATRLDSERACSNFRHDSHSDVRLFVHSHHYLREFSDREPPARRPGHMPRPDLHMV